MSGSADLLRAVSRGDPRGVARAITLVEAGGDRAGDLLAGLDAARVNQCLLLGVTGPPGAGKSTLVSGLVRELRRKGEQVGVVAIDPSSPLSGGAVLGDRVRMMEHALDSGVFLRSMASRGRLGGLCTAAAGAARIMAAAGCGVVILETVGVGQLEMDVVRQADLSVLVLAPGFGDEVQAMKAGVLEVVDLLVVNKADLPGAERLALDLDSAARPGKRLFRTVATEGQGVAELLERILSLARTFQETGERRRRRQQARRFEILDRAVEIARARLIQGLKTCADQDREPALAARELVWRVFDRGVVDE